MKPAHSTLGFALAALWSVALVRAGFEAVHLGRFRSFFFKLLLTALAAIAYVCIRLLMRNRTERLAGILVLGCFGLLSSGVIAAVTCGIVYYSTHRNPSGLIEFSFLPIFFGTLIWLVLRNREEVCSDSEVIRVCATINTVLSAIAIPILGYWFLAGMARGLTAGGSSK
jgi:hypothetical protein